MQRLQQRTLARDQVDRDNEQQYTEPTRGRHRLLAKAEQPVVIDNDRGYHLPSNGQCEQQQRAKSRTGKVAVATYKAPNRPPNQAQAGTLSH